MLLAYGSLRVVTQWKQELDANINLPNGNGIPVVLLGNKVLYRHAEAPSGQGSFGVGDFSRVVALLTVVPLVRGSVIIWRDVLYSPMQAQWWMPTRYDANQ